MHLVSIGRLSRREARQLRLASLIDNKLIETMKTETYSLRDNTISFEIEVPDSSNVAALSDEQRVALANAALAYWSYRGAAKKDNNGKTFSLAEVSADLLTVRVRTGEPSKIDIDKAEAWMKQEQKRIAALDLPDTLPDGPEAAREWMNEQELDALQGLVERNEKKFSFEFTHDIEFTKSCVGQFMRAVRLAKLRMARESDLA